VLQTSVVETSVLETSVLQRRCPWNPCFASSGPGMPADGTNDLLVSEVIRTGEL
jgi:hypothetical protein